jgi:O-acetyl-ADP-ribose deacetylase (regulator of RNase III)
MIKIINGNILNAKENIICHQVNCKGVMGAGLAKQIVDKYPFIYPVYKKYCNSGKVILGTVLWSTINPLMPQFIANLFAQEDYGRSNYKVYTNYIALEQCFTLVKNNGLENSQLTIAIPYNIGCGLANGDWGIVYDMIYRVFEESDVTIYDWIKR